VGNCEFKENTSALKNYGDIELCEGIRIWNVSWGGIHDQFDSSTISPYFVPGEVGCLVGPSRGKEKAEMGQEKKPRLSKNRTRK